MNSGYCLLVDEWRSIQPSISDNKLNVIRGEIKDFNCNPLYKESQFR